MSSEGRPGLHRGGRSPAWADRGGDAGHGPARTRGQRRQIRRALDAVGPRPRRLAAGGAGPFAAGLGGVRRPAGQAAEPTRLRLEADREGSRRRAARRGPPRVPARRRALHHGHGAWTGCPRIEVPRIRARSRARRRGKRVARARQTTTPESAPALAPTVRRRRSACGRDQMPRPAGGEPIRRRRVLFRSYAAAMSPSLGF